MLGSGALFDLGSHIIDQALVIIAVSVEDEKNILFHTKLIQS